MKRAVWSWRGLVPVTAALVVSIAVGGCGTSDREEDCFQIGGDLQQVTTDTLTVDHFSASLAPDGVRVLFSSDVWVEEFEREKLNGERDFGLIFLPTPGEVRRPVPSIHDVGNAKRVVVADLPNDTGSSLFSVLDKNKGEIAWANTNVTPDQFVAVIQNSNRRDRIYVLQLGAVDSASTTVAASFVRLINDIGLQTVPEDNYYYGSPAVSPDGRWLAYTRYFYRAANQAAGIEERSEPQAIFAYDLQSPSNSPTVVRVSKGSSLERDLAWSPDGNSIVFTGNGGRVGTEEIYRIRFDPANPAVEGQDDGRVRLTFTTGEDDLKLPARSFDPFWMRNGRIVFTSTQRPPCTSERRRNLWSMDGSGGDLRLVVYSDEDDHFAGGCNFTGAVSSADNAIVFSSRQNPVVEFKGQKNDLWVLRGGF